MKITKSTKQNGVKIYTLEDKGNVIAESTDLNKLEEKKKTTIKEQ